MPSLTPEILIIAFGAIALVVFVAVRWVTVMPDEAYIVRDPFNDFTRVLTRTTLLVNPLEQLIRGRRAARFEFPSCDAAGTARPCHLRHHPSGAIDLRPQFCASDFIVSTNEPIEMRVRTTLQFRVDPANLRNLHDLGDNFGRALISRIKTAFGAEFRKRKDEIVRKEMELIQQSVLERLRELERTKPLGVIFDSIDEFDFSQAREPHRTRSVVAAVGDGSPSPHVAGVAGLTPHPDGVAFMEPSEYDVIMNLFDNPAQKMQALLAILEMQTRRDIAEALAKSQQLVVVTGQDFGFAGGAVQNAVRQGLGRPPEPTHSSPEGPKE